MPASISRCSILTNISGNIHNYLADQTPEEVTFIKHFDLDEDKAGLNPYSAFLDTTSPGHAPDCQSIKVGGLGIRRSCLRIEIVVICDIDQSLGYGGSIVMKTQSESTSQAVADML